MEVAALKRDAVQNTRFPIGRAIPWLTIIFMILLDISPLPFLTPIDAAPLFTIAALFYWSAFYPELFGVGAIFATSLLFDVLSGAPVGLTSLSVLLAYAVLWPRRQFLLGHGLPLIWVSFTMACSVVLALRWGLICLWYGRFYSVDAAMMEVILTAAAFPVVYWLLMYCSQPLAKVTLASRS